MTDTVLFDEPSHTYTVNGVNYPSVSTVLSLFADYSRVPRAVLEFKRQIGRATHYAIQLYETGELDLDSVDDQVMPYLEGWIKLKADMPGRVVAGEQIVYHKKYRYAGRLDLNYLLDRDHSLWQWDIKCTYQMEPATALQTAAYTEAANHMNPDLQPITKRAGVQLCPDGSYVFYPYTKPEHRTDFNIFLNALNCYRWLMNHGK